MDLRREVGRLGEEAATAALLQRGYRIIERNWRCRLGEVDIIAWQARQLVFIEVRTRSGTGYGTPQESVTREKQQRLHRLAQVYFQAHEWKDVACRFDVVAVTVKGLAVQAVEVIEGAF